MFPWFAYQDNKQTNVPLCAASRRPLPRVFTQSRQPTNNEKGNFPSQISNESVAFNPGFWSRLSVNYQRYLTDMIYLASGQGLKPAP